MPPVRRNKNLADEFVFCLLAEDSYQVFSKQNLQWFSPSDKNVCSNISTTKKSWEDMLPWLFREIQVIIATRFLKRVSVYTLELRTSVVIFMHNTFYCIWLFKEWVNDFKMSELSTGSCANNTTSPASLCTKINLTIKNCPCYLKNKGSRLPHIFIIVSDIVLQLWWGLAVFGR